MLAMLLAHNGQVVPADKLTAELWPALAPERAAATLQVRLSELRKALRPAQADDMLTTRSPGYLLRVAPEDLDAARFEQLAARGEAALAEGDPEDAARQLDEALSLWRGPAFADADAAPSVRSAANRLSELRLAALESRAEALLACGRHRELIAELEALTAANPLRERFWYQRMLALYLSGRQADALRAYRDLRAVLVDELGVEPGPELRELQARILDQDPALGGSRPRRPARSAAFAPPQTHYVQSDDGIHIAYQVIGQGERDILYVPGLMSHLELLWEDEDTAAFFRRLACLGRVILFDKRDTGLSDRSPADASLEERMADVLAVMRAARSKQAVLFGYSEGAPMSILFAATYPERVSALILGSAAARWFPADDYPCGDSTEELYQSLKHIAEHQWGEGATIDWYLPSRAGSAHARELFGRFERMAISPSAFLRMLRMIREIDVRDVLPAIHQPTLVIHRLNDRVTPPFHGRYLVSRIAGAQYFEQPGDHSLRFAGGGDADALHEAIAGFLDGAPPAGDVSRVLTTILVAVLPDGIPHTDRARDNPDLPLGKAIVTRRVAAHRGHVITSSATTMLATFDAPGLAVRCAAAIRADAAGDGTRLQAGVHTGEVDLLGGDVRGPAVQFAHRITALACPDEILISRTVRDLIAGSGIALLDHGGRLQAEGEDWPVFAVARDALPDAVQVLER